MYLKNMYQLPSIRCGRYNDIWNKRKMHRKNKRRPALQVQIIESSSKKNDNLHAEKKS